MSTADETRKPIIDRMLETVVDHLRSKTSPVTRKRHAKWRTLPPRAPADILDRLIARDAKLARRAAAARKAGLLP